GWHASVAVFFDGRDDFDCDAIRGKRLSRIEVVRDRSARGGCPDDGVALYPAVCQAGRRTIHGSGGALCPASANEARQKVEALNRLGSCACSPPFEQGRAHMLIARLSTARAASFTASDSVG